MARMLGDQPNEIRFKDQLGGGDIALFYSTPTPDMRAKYANEMIRREGGKIVRRVGEVRQRYGARILTGIRDGDFTSAAGPVSSDPKSGAYRKDWKELVSQYASDLVELLAAHVFEGSAALKETEPDEDADESPDEDDAEKK